MNDVNKNIRSHEVEQALKILESDRDAAMEDYLFPRGMNWIELYISNMRGNATQSLALIKTIRDNLIFKDAEDIKLTPTFNTLTVNAAEIVRRAAALKEIFLSHFGIDLDEERPKVCLDKETKNEKKENAE